MLTDLLLETSLLKEKLIVFSVFLDVEYATESLSGDGS